MKRVSYYIVAMLVVIIILPMFIVKGFIPIPEKEENNEGESITSKEKKEIDLKEISLKDKDKGEYDTRIFVYIKSEDKVEEMAIEEYITGVVAAEMPAEFAYEALKAQAVAARTYAYGRLKGLYKNEDGYHDNADVCTDYSHCQAWISKEEAMKRWDDDNKDEYWNKIKNAVEETRGIIIMYKNIVANPLFHSNSGGKTENAEDVWDIGSVDYLKSVKSEGEEACPTFKTVKEVSAAEFCNTLGKYYPETKLNKNNIFEEIEILDQTQGDRVRTIRIKDIIIKGTDFRKIFSLPSANFSINNKNNKIVEITTLGNGHGVGMSQWGANYLAKCNKTWEEILKYYYTGIELDTINNIEKTSFESI
jgi:stage II sporulation protein D